MINIIQLFAIALGGAIGAVSRHCISMIAAARFPNPFIPYGTLGANVLGSFLIGAISALTLKMPLSPTAKLFLITGILGALTTFSAYSMDTFTMIQSGKYTAALSNLALNNLLSISAAAIAYTLIK